MSRSFQGFIPHPPGAPDPGRRGRRTANRVRILLAVLVIVPVTAAADGFAQVYEPYYFAHGDSGYRVFDAAGAKIGIAICQDRRYPESYRALALQGAELILIGYKRPSPPWRWT